MRNTINKIGDSTLGRFILLGILFGAVPCFLMLKAYAALRN